MSFSAHVDHVIITWFPVVIVIVTNYDVFPAVYALVIQSVASSHGNYKINYTISTGPA